MSPSIWSCVEFSLLIKMMCLICPLGVFAWIGIGFAPCGDVPLTKPLFLRTLSVYARSVELLGAGIMFTVPIVLDFGDPIPSLGGLHAMRVGHVQSITVAADLNRARPPAHGNVAE